MKYPYPCAICLKEFISINHPKRNINTNNGKFHGTVFNIQELLQDIITFGNTIGRQKHHSKSRFFLFSQNFSFSYFVQEKIQKYHQKAHYTIKCEEKTFKELKIHQVLVCAYKSQDFAQIQKNVALFHDRVTVTFRNSGQKT